MKKNIPIMFLISFLQGMVFYASVATIYRTTFGLTLFDISLIEGINYALCILLEMPWGIWADRIGYRRSMILCCFLYFVSKILFWKADSFLMFLAERILLAVVFAGLSGLDTSILYCSDEENSQRNFGFYTAFGTAGMLVSSFIFAVCIKDDLRLSAFVTIIPYLIAFLLSLGLTEVKDLSEKPAPGNMFTLIKETVTNRKLMMLLVSTALFSETTHLLAVFLNQQKYLSVGLTLSQIAFVNIVMNFLDMSNAFSKKLSDVFGRNRFAVMILLLQIIFILCAAWSSAAIPVIVSFCMIDILYGFFIPITNSIQHEMVTTDDRASRISANAMIVDLICIAVIVICGKIADMDLRAGILSCAVLTALALFLFVRSRRCSA